MGINSAIIPRFPLDEIQVLIYYLDLIGRGQFQRLSLGLPHMRTQGQGPNVGLPSASQYIYSQLCTQSLGK